MSAALSYREAELMLALRVGGKRLHPMALAMEAPLSALSPGVASFPASWSMIVHPQAVHET